MKPKNLLWYFVGNHLKWLWPFRVITLFKKGISIVDKRTQLCIEGYPRSGNTYLYALCKQFIDPTVIAHHLHNCAQLKSAIDNQVPVLFVARNPLDAISSYVIREEISPKRALQQYIALYTFVSKVKNEITVVRFDDLINDPINILAKTSSITGIQFQGKIEQGRLHKEIKEMDRLDQGTSEVNPLKVGLPSDERNQLKTKLIEECRSKHSRLLAIAETVHMTVIK